VLEGGASEVKEIMNLEGEMRPICRGIRHEWAHRQREVMMISGKVQRGGTSGKNKGNMRRNEDRSNEIDRVKRVR
jgi:hypothetical protein